EPVALPVVVDPVAKAVLDPRGVDPDAAAGKTDLSHARRIELGDWRVAADHHPVEGVFDAGRRIADEALAALATLQRRQAGEEPAVLGHPLEVHRHVRLHQTWVGGDRDQVAAAGYPTQADAIPVILGGELV